MVKDHSMRPLLNLLIQGLAALQSLIKEFPLPDPSQFQLPLRQQKTLIVLNGLLKKL